MKKALILTLGFFFCLSAVLQNQIGFGSFSAVEKSALGKAQGPSQIFVQFVQPKSFSRIAVENGQNSTLALQCLFSNSGSKDLVQPTAQLNLNQPANCFNLQVSYTAPKHARLAVTGLKQNTVRIVVEIPPTRIHNPALKSAPVMPALPILPVAVYAIIASLVYLKRSTLVKAVNQLSGIKTTFNLHQLMVLRC